MHPFLSAFMDVLGYEVPRAAKGTQVRILGTWAMSYISAALRTTIFHLISAALFV
jgi:hypothetical protein